VIAAAFFLCCVFVVAGRAWAGDSYRQLRLGVHLTIMKAEEIEWSAALGWATDSQRRASPYLRLNMLRRL